MTQDDHHRTDSSTGAAAEKGFLVRPFSDLSSADVPAVGGKNAALGELYRELRPWGVPVPDGFAVTADAYRHMLAASGLESQLRAALDGLDAENVADLARRGRQARELILGARIPDDLQAEILAGYQRLKAENGDSISLAVRSSATAEDLPTASFAGQQDTFLNVQGEASLLDACRRCFASLFTDRAIHYRIERGFDHFAVALSIGVQRMVRSDLASSGVMFTLDTETGFPDIVIISAAWGLGETVVQGTVDPDEYGVHKPTFKGGFRSVLRRRLGTKKIKTIYAPGRTREAIRTVRTAAEERRRFCLEDDEILGLAELAIRIEEHFSSLAGRPTPMDIEWAKDGVDGKLYIVQARPETVVSQRSGHRLEQDRLIGTGRVLVSGQAVGTRIATGRARLITDASELTGFLPGEVLVAETTTPDWEPVMKRAAAIVSNRGGRTCHAAIVARELGIPAVVGASGATDILTADEPVTVSCAEGEVGRVLEGKVAFETTTVDLEQLERPQTEIMVNLGNPELAFKVAMLPTDGVGLARIEFIISEHVKAHPMALLHPERIEDAAQRLEIERLTAGWASPAEFFVRTLSEGIGTIVAAFDPRPVIVRLSDFKTNEYAALLGGAAFEPTESNPMLGFRGAARYADPKYQEGFALECQAILRVRETMGLRNLKVMIPFCRRVAEAEKVLAVMAEQGLVRGEHGLEVYVMCEIPNNVLLIDEFAKLFDGFSNGSNDLTQLILGVDRDSETVAFDFDERDPGVLKMIRLAVEGAHRNARHIGICGQAPSDFPEMAEYLVRLGINSISLTPDTVVATSQRVLELEKTLAKESAQPTT